MKINIIHYIAVALFSFQSFNAQIDRSKAPKAKEPKAIQFGETNSFSLKNGLKVIVVENHKLPQVRFDLFLNNGPILEGDKAGYASMLGSMMKAGTQNYSKEKLDESIDYLGTDFYFGSNSGGFSSLKKQMIPSLELFTEILFKPTLNNKEELDKLKTQQLTSLETQAKNPDAISGIVENVLLYGKNDPYGEIITEETIQNIQLEDFKNLYNEMVIPNNAYLTIVGDITLKEAKKLVNTYFKKWKASQYVKKEYPLEPNKSGNYIAFVDLPSASQSLIKIINLNNFKKSNPDYFAGLIGNSLLGGNGFSTRLMQNIREDKGWTYGAYSSLSDSYNRLGEFSANAKVRNEVTDSAVIEFMKEIQFMETQLVSTKDLEGKIANYNGTFALGLESPQTLARYMRTLSIEGLPQDFYANYLSNINKVTASDVKEAMKKYVDSKNLIITVVGKGIEVIPSLEKLGMPIKYFDRFGNEVEKPKMSKAIPKDVSLEMILDKAMKALGNTKNIQSIKTLHEGEIQGQKLQVSTTKMNPNKIWIKVELPAFGMVAQETKFNGTKGYNSQQGVKKEMDEKEVMEYASKSSMFSVLDLKNKLSKITATDIEPINGRDAYKLSLNENEKPSHYYIDVENGQLIQESRTITNPQTKEDILLDTQYTDFKDYEGLLLPSVIIQPLGPGQNINLNLKEVKINKEVKAEDFN